MFGNGPAGSAYPQVVGGNGFRANSTTQVTGGG
jgi:hypothetical protein